jgi:hypothetical protein
VTGKKDPIREWLHRSWPCLRSEVLHPDSAQFFNYSASAENAAVGSQLNLVDYVLRSIGGWVRNVQIFRRILARERYDLAIGDETYEVLIALIFGLLRIQIPFVMICDFFGLDSTTGKPLERIGTYILNWIWSKDYRVFRAKDRLALFVGEPEDVPDASLGRWLPNRREYAKAHYRFIGYVFVNFRPRMCHLFSARMYHLFSAKMCRSFSAEMYHPMSSGETPLTA